MNDTVILQQIYPNSAYAAAIALTLPRTLEYANAHAMDYEFYHGQVASFLDPQMGGWAKLPLIINALQRNYQYVVWMDADSLIADMNADLREGCPNGIGLVEHCSSTRHYNVGNIYIKGSQEVLDFLCEWMSWYPGPQGWHEQAVLNLLSYTPRWKNIVKAIDSRWNSCQKGNTHVDDAIVEGFHGEGNIARRVKLMKAFLGMKNARS